MKRAAVIGIVAGAVVLLAGGAATTWFLTRPAGPDATAQAFLDALAAGDAARALAMVESPPTGIDLAAAYEGAAAILTDPVVGGVGSAEGQQTRAEVAFELDGESRTASFGLVETADGWRIAADALGTAEVTSTIGDSVTIGDALVPTGSTPLLPAAYPVEAAPARLLEGVSEVLILPGAATGAAIEASVAPEATAAAQRKLDDYADACAAPGATVPENCGLRVPWAADLATLTSIAFRVDQHPRVELATDGLSFDAIEGIVVATASGQTRDGVPGTFTYRADDWALRGRVAFTDGEMLLTVR